MNLFKNYLIKSALTRNLLYSAFSWSIIYLWTLAVQNSNNIAQTIEDEKQRSLRFDVILAKINWSFTVCTLAKKKENFELNILWRTIFDVTACWLELLLWLFALELEHGEEGVYCFARNVKWLTQFGDTSKVEEAKWFPFFFFIKRKSIPPLFNF